MFTTYILQSVTSGRFYIGQTQDISSRLIKYNSGQVKSTSGNCPWKLVWSKNFETRKEAYKEEQRIKSFKKRKNILELIEHKSNLYIFATPLRDNVRGAAPACRQVALKKLSSGCSVARLSRLLWEQEVAGSNPATPTNESLSRFNKL